MIPDHPLNVFSINVLSLTSCFRLRKFGFSKSLVQLGDVPSADPHAPAVTVDCL